MAAQFESGIDGCGAPLAFREEVNEAGAERQKVAPVTKVLGKDDLTASPQDSCGFAEELDAGFVTAQFVRGEDEEHGIAVGAG